MTTNRVDTTLPEYSWIPFYEELAHKLLNEGWRTKQPELVQMLKEMKKDDVHIHPIVSNLSSHIDPFTVFALFTYDLGWDKKRKVMEAFKSNFSMESSIPQDEPVVPTLPGIGIGFFAGYDGIGGDIEILWNVFEFIFKLDLSDESTDQNELTRLIDDGLKIRGVGMSKLTAGLYWVNPFNFLHIGTINGVAKLASGEQLKDTGTATDYLRCLQKTREIDLKPFPIMNYEVYEETYKLPGPKVWVVQAHRGQGTDAFVSKGYIGIHYDMGNVDLSAVKSSNGLFERIKELYKQEHPGEDNPYRIGHNAGMIRSFIMTIQSGDYVITPTDGDEFYYGIVADDISYCPEDDIYQNRRKTYWERVPLHQNHWASIPLPSQNTIFSVIGKNRLNEFFKLIGRDDLVVDDDNGPPHPKIYTIQSMLDEGVFLEHEDIERMKEILQNKKNLILQGPPGVGKTFIARKLAYVLMGEKADARITSVQFHQSYSYEDFVGGLRPDVSDDQQLIFTPQDGTFLKLCDRARDDSDNKYVMLIDEVNRGNLSRVFGELLMLIEADKRTEDNAIELQHQTSSSRGADNSDDDDGKADKFFVPENVYIIGTMNLADRSLTGMNIAMRRRFGFVELEPQFDKNVFTKWLSDKTNMPNDMQTRIHSKMSALNDAIAGDVSLGKNYAVGHSFFCPSEEVTDWEEWYKRVVDYEIRPLLEEYWFDKLEEANKHVKDLKEG